MNYTLSIKSHTWNKESNLLYDYESTDYNAAELSVNESGILGKIEKKLIFQKKLENPTEYVAHFNYDKDEYNIVIDEDFERKENKPIKSLDDKLWIVIKKTVYDGNLGHRLREGDVIKLGKVMFKVKELKSEERQAIKALKSLVKEKTRGDAVKSGNNNVVKEIGMNVNLNSNINPNLNHFVNVEMGAIGDGIIGVGVNPATKKQRVSSSICKICLMDDNEPDNPLINPCSCIGSVRYIHLLCIQQWLKSKITSKVFNFLTVHSFKNNFECEICKTAIPERLKFRNEVLYLIDYQKPETNYIMLESISREKRETKYFYIIHMNEKSNIKLGRSNDSDVRMTDISVSRNHAFLKLIKGDFYLEDNASKFGTLTQIQNDFIVFPNKQFAVQSGKIFIILALQKTCFAWLRCYANKKLNVMDYNAYFESKSPNSYHDELENLQVVNTDYTISDGMSNIKQSEKANSIKEFIDYDTFIYKQIEKHLKELKEDINNDMGEDYENNIDGIVEGNIDGMDNEQNYTSINFKTNNDMSVQKLVLTENSKKGSVTYTSERMEKIEIKNKIPIYKNDSKSNKTGKTEKMEKPGRNKYRNIPNMSGSGSNFIQRDGSNLFPGLNELEGINNHATNSSNDYGEPLERHHQISVIPLGLGYNSNQTKAPTNLETISILNTIEDQMRGAPRSTKNIKKAEFFKLKTSTSFERRESKPDRLTNIKDEIIPFKIPKSKTKNPNEQSNGLSNANLASLNDILEEINMNNNIHLGVNGSISNKSNNRDNNYNSNPESQIIKTDSHYASNEAEVVKSMIDNLFGGLIHYNSNQNLQYDTNPLEIQLDSENLKIKSEHNLMDDSDIIKKNIQIEEHNIQDKLSNNFLINNRNKTEIRRRVKKMSDSSLPSYRNSNMSQMNPGVEFHTPRKNTSSSFLIIDCMDSRRSKFSSID